MGCPLPGEQDEGLHQLLALKFFFTNLDMARPSQQHAASSWPVHHLCCSPSETLLVKLWP